MHLSRRPCMDESVESPVIWLDSTGCAPADKFLRVDYDPHDEKARSLSAALRILSEFTPSLIVPGHIGRIVHDFENARIFLRLEPSRSNTNGATNNSGR